jgi:outer membrane receptor for ferrienterochelin and colicins
VRALYLALVFALGVSASAQTTATLRIEVLADDKPAGGVTVVVNGVTHSTDAQGRLALPVPPGSIEITAVKEGFNPVTTSLVVAAGQDQRVVMELNRESALREEVTVVASTRTGRRVEDEPIRVEVVPQEEIDEKVFMTPGDVSMMLTETNGLRVQVTSPSLGAANVRVQGLRGRYTQVLSDGLPLYGSTGSIGILQIPPMDLAQVEVIKGVASALYGGSALGGVINLISRQPQRDRPERELLLNRTTRGGTDGVLWLSKHGAGNWGYTFLGGGHFQQRADVDEDGWTDLPSYERVNARPRIMWDNGQGRSVFFTVGAMTEDRSGGAMPSRLAPDGAPFPENLRTRRFDAGVVARVLLGADRIFTFRSSGLAQWHRHEFGTDADNDLHHTWFGEGALIGGSGQHKWVLGAALQRDLYRSDELPAFNYTHAVPGVFAQDDYTPVSWLTVSGSARLDHHNEFGGFLSPRVSALLRPATGWTTRLSAGTGFFAPTPFTEETEAVGLTRLAPLGDLEPERGRSLSFDVGWKRGAMELNATLFRSMIQHPILLRESPLSAQFPLQIVNAEQPTRTVGSEAIARFHVEGMDLIATHMYVWGTEPDPNTGIRREMPLNPRHTAGVDWLWEIRQGVRLGVEFFYTGRQQIDDSPYRTRSEPYLLWGAVAEWRVGRARIYANVENLSDVRQTRHDSLVRPSRSPEGLWTVDAWGPLEGRILNGGIRFGF